MKKTILSSVLFMNTLCVFSQQPLAEKFERFPFGSIRPTGWIKTQMQKDMNGFVGNLDKLVPDLINDPIYGSGRLQKHSKAKDLGNMKEGDAAGDDQYKWWNSETQSNWRDGYIRNAFLLNDKPAIENVKKYINQVLATQDEDGYLGIYDRELRYRFSSENGELWAKATLYRGLLAYYECTQELRVWNALVKAVDDVMRHYPINTSEPFYAGKEFSGGVAHGLTFTDVLDRMYQLTKDQKYSQYAEFLYLNFSKNYSSEKDVQLANILNPDFKLQSHGVHTYEHLRPLIVAAYASGNADLQKALKLYLEKIKRSTTFTGGPIGDEWIAERAANATHTGYEYCSIQELMDSYTVLLQKQGTASIGDEIENIFYNAAQGSRDPQHSCIAYLKTDNSFEMMGTRNGEVEPDRKQTRYKYSPAHQDVAVCCNPNAGRITPYFVQSAWMKEGENTLVATLLMPNILKTKWGNSSLTIETVTNYPYGNKFQLAVKQDKPKKMTLKIRIPAWVNAIKTNENYKLVDGYMIVDRQFGATDKVDFEFETDVKIKQDLNNEKYMSYGALVYAKPIEATLSQTRKYAPGFEDLNYLPKNTSRYQLPDKAIPQYQNGVIQILLKNTSTGELEKTELIPFGKTILRQVSF